MEQEDLLDYEGGNNSLYDGLMERPLLGGALFEGIPVTDSQETEVISSQETQPQTRRVLCGVPVHFPGEPYETQVIMMENVINSLNSGENSLIESPTGSGKTLALLCAVLGWSAHEYLRDPEAHAHKKIFYCTKTHAQVSTVIKELRKTYYASSELPRLKVSVLGSRGQMCVNEDVLQGGNDKVDDTCEKLVRNFRRSNSNRGSSQRQQRTPTPQQPLPTCQFYKDTSNDYFFNEEDHVRVIRDIEDLRTTARQQGCCPFYGSRRLLRTSNLVICPYNYIISSYIRQSMNIDLRNSIIIFDEGHNLEKVLCAEGSMSLTGKLFGEVLRKCRELNRQSEASATVTTASSRLFNIFRDIYEWIKSFNEVDNRWLPSGRIVIEALSTKGLGRNDLNTLKSDLALVTDSSESEHTLDKITSQRIQKIISVLEYVYESENIEENYFLYLENIFRGNCVVGEKINIICVNPAQVFRNISSQTSSITITSGTLTPLDSYSRELNIPFPEPLTLEQTIPRERYFVAKLAVAPDGPLPDLVYKEWSKSAVQKKVGNVIAQICEVVPNGVVAFFPSKACIQKMKETWECDFSAAESIMDRIRGVKHVIDECDMKDPQQARELLRQYREKSREGRGALLLGVHRGKVSEGVDFIDQEARAVINIGIPYAPPTAPEFVAKKTYYEGDQDMFWRWYQTEALRAVNQCLGRSVRHRNDWGAIIMVDPRFLHAGISQLIPPWIDEASRIYAHSVNNGFETMIDDLRVFVGNRILNG